MQREALKVMEERFGHDTLSSVATVDGNKPAVRTVNSYYENGAFHVATHLLSNKMKQLKTTPLWRYAASGMAMDILMKKIKIRAC